VDEITAHLDQPSTIAIENMLRDYSSQAVVMVVTHQWDTLLRLKVPTILFIGERAQLLTAEETYDNLLKTLK
jgi:ABC-type transport system involved in cytochrome bd biosynthesis fused ATPase/permease subunit